MEALKWYNYYNVLEIIPGCYRVLTTTFIVTLKAGFADMAKAFDEVVKVIHNGTMLHDLMLLDIILC